MLITGHKRPANLFLPESEFLIFQRKSTTKHAIQHNCDLLLDSSPLERLEPKFMLAGVVKASVNARGDLSIRGDGNDNYVTITAEDTNADGVDDSFTITGNASPDGESTLIRIGRDTVSTITLEATGKLKVAGGGGDDFVRIEDVSHVGDFQYSGGGGGDSLGIFDSSLTGTQKWRTGSGNDVAIVTNSVIDGALNLNSGGGSDWLGLVDSTHNGEDLKAKTGGGPDILSFEGSTINSSVDVNTGGFPDAIYLGSGTTFTSSVDIDLSSFADALMVENGVTFTNLSEVTITANKPGPNYENAAFIESGVDLTTLPDLSSYYLQFVADDISEEFDARMSNIDVNIQFFDSLRMLLFDRGFAWEELPISQTALTNAEMNALESNILAGLNSPEQLERLLFENIFEDDYA